MCEILSVAEKLKNLALCGFGSLQRSISKHHYPLLLMCKLYVIIKYYELYGCNIPWKWPYNGTKYHYQTLYPTDLLEKHIKKHAKLQHL